MLGLSHKDAPREMHPLIYLLPKLFEEILTDPSIKDIISPTAEEIKKIYGVDLFDAKVIDVRAREYLSKRNKLEPGVTKLTFPPLQSNVIGVDILFPKFKSIVKTPST